VDHSSFTPLHCAAAAGHATTVEALLVAMADAERTDRNERVPLHAAAYAGHESCVSVLLESRAAVDPLDNQRRTPLYYAGTNQHKAAAGRLSDGGADMSILFLAAKQKFGTHQIVGNDWPVYNGRFMTTVEGREFPLRPEDGGVTVLP
jgi:ankyrin repeat protein